MDDDTIVGIDLGTTNSCVGIWDWENNRVEILSNENGKRTTPSYVSYCRDEKLVGDAAKAKQGQNVENTIFNAKRIIGRPFTHIRRQDMDSWQYRVVGTPENNPRYRVMYREREIDVSPEEVSALILAKLKRIAEDYMGRPVRKAVVTVPAYFTEPQKQATKDAAQIAGLDVVMLLTEPTAAALAYGLDKRALSENGKRDKAQIDGLYILVFDLGGGTFDVSVLKLDGRGSFITKAITGDFHLGGEDFDARMVEEFTRRLKKEYPNLVLSKKSHHKIRTECERAKQNLSQLSEYTAEVDIQGVEFTFTITRDRFNEICADLYEAVMEEVRQALTLADIQKDEIDDIVLVGGSTRIPAIQERLQKFFRGKQLWNRINPDEAVAYGATIQAAALTKQRPEQLSKLTLTQVTPITLGIELSDGTFDTLISRATKMPCVKSEFYTTSVNNQKSVIIKVYEGDHKVASNNFMLGKFSLPLEAAPAGNPKVEVKFEVSVDGLLSVSATELNTNKKMVVQFEKTNLSEAEKNNMMQGCTA